MPDISTRMYVRLYAEGGSENASNVARKLCQLLSEFADGISSRTPGPYWKVPSYYEVFAQFEVLGTLPETLTFVSAALGTGWSQPTGHYAVWDHRTGGALFDSSVRWANIEPE